METEVTYRVVRAMGWVGLEVDGTVTLTLTDDGITCDPPIGASQLHSALHLGYIEAVDSLNDSHCPEPAQSPRHLRLVG